MEKLKQTKLILLLSYISLAAVAAAVISPALPAIKQSLKLSNGSLEWVISIFLISYAFGQLFYGPLANILRITQALKIGIIIPTIGIVICLFYSYQMDYQGILIGRFITNRLSIWSRMHVYSHKRNTSCKTSKNGFFIHLCHLRWELALLRQLES